MQGAQQIPNKQNKYEENRIWTRHNQTAKKTNLKRKEEILKAPRKKNKIHYIQRNSNTNEGWLPVRNNRNKKTVDQNPKRSKKKNLYKNIQNKDTTQYIFR